MKKIKVKHKILVVDDEQEVRNLICEYLKKRGFATICAKDGRDAISQLNKKPSLIILDVMMPVIDGFAFLRSVRVDIKYSQIPIIMLTVKNSKYYVGKGISMEADFYLPKPFKLDNLLSFINLILG